MTNHMKEITRILGVELGEEFIARRTDENVFCKCEINDCGLMAGINKSPRILGELLCGIRKVEKLPWKPILGEDYYYHHMDMDGEIQSSVTTWNGDFCDARNYMIGDCHKTKEECEEDVASADRLKNMVRVKECRE